MIIEVPAGAPRITLRHLDADGRASDLVGHLIAADDDRLVVLPEDKPAVWLQRSMVKNLKRVPERTVLPASPPDAMQRMLDRTWPGLRRARLGGWVLRDGNRRTTRANSTLVGGDPGMPWNEALTLADEWRGRPTILQVVMGDPVIDLAKAAGYELRGPTVVMVARADDLPYDHVEVKKSSEPDEGWLSIWRGGRTDADLVAEMTSAPATYAQIPGIAVGRVALWGSWAVISSVEVAPALRGTGWGRAMTRALVDSVECRFVALQVGEENTAARSLYAKEGFVEHHTYAYLFPPTAG
ncbi:GNAT family N-acetyltransferase [Tessaracoccus sp. MC1865]|uniref:GNAT family N-acetyltransferase n=1 Tax=Tessaracoccus sp. MC1865 TaxID=2760310 RepID=UPI0015FEE4F8|nr:GNAT family N-acetyltransferase [Tessaracoccus sp. MC1865]MBB1484553.1 GNAT family N-acetyltransferase [Tessaracoccus sp. MC1865]QTO38354.1 GNAT family N-acetyltransferase [Tessaracoccus sp. MC1865]